MLKKLLFFCDRENDRVSQPVDIGGYTYASDGRIIVRVPCLGVGPAAANYPDVEGMLDWRQIELCGSSGTLITAAELLGRKPGYTCDKCDAEKGRPRQQCPECAGDGFIIFDNDFNSYEVDCKTCRGDGDLHHGLYMVEQCPHCLGTKWREYAVWQLTGACTVWLALRVLGLIVETLGDIRIFPVQERKAVPFTFAGGDGFVMPVYPGDEQTIVNAVRL